MKVIETCKRRNYIKPIMRVVEIKTCSIICGSGKFRINGFEEDDEPLDAN